MHEWARMVWMAEEKIRRVEVADREAQLVAGWKLTLTCEQE